MEPKLRQASEVQKIDFSGGRFVVEAAVQQPGFQTPLQSVMVPLEAFLHLFTGPYQYSYQDTGF